MQLQYSPTKTLTMIFYTTIGRNLKAESDQDKQSEINAAKLICIFLDISVILCILSAKM
jgi:hypothetical protein